MTGFCTRHTTRHSAGTALIRGLCLLALLLPGLAAAAQPPLEVIDFQLRWKHQFQFAGYYAAIAQGYYRLNSTHKCNAHPCINFVRRLPAQAFSRA